MLGLSRNPFVSICVFSIVLGLIGTIITAQSDAQLKSMIREVSTPEYATLQVIVMKGKPGMFRIPEDLDKAVASALAGGCSKGDYPSCSLFNRRNFKKMYEKEIMKQCGKILPVFSNNEMRLNEIMQQSGVHEESRLQAMGIYCRDLVKRERRDKIYKLFMKDRKGSKSSGDSKKNIFSAFRRSKNDKGSAPYELNKNANQDDGADGFIDIEPSDFAISGGPETHDPNFDYGDEDDMIVGPRKHS